MLGKLKNYKGFTLVELLAVIVIVGILLTVGIVSVLKLIERAKNEQTDQQEKTISIAAESYFQDNRSYLPKEIGKTTTISLADLKDAKYITENIKNASGQSCMENSIVEVTKKSTTEYTYKTVLYCGDEKPSDEDGIFPAITVNYVNEKNEIIEDTEHISDVSNAKFIIKITSGGDNVVLNGYSYTIMSGEKDTSDLREVYSSGSLNANNRKEITISNDNSLKNYIDITKTTSVLIKVSAINELGKVTNRVSTLGQIEQEGASGTYKDTVAPECNTILNEATQDTWINKASTDTERTITVVCSDGNGSGCIRSTFTKTWNVDNEAVKKGVIEIKDNVGNTTQCSVNVFIDKTAPVIKLDAFAKESDIGNDSKSVLVNGKATTENKPNDSATIDANSSNYKNLFGVFMNKANYKDGVVYSAKLSDKYLDSWTWKTNAENLDIADVNFNTLGVGSDSKSGSCKNSSSCDIVIGFNKDGYRKGQLVVKDEAGNTAIFTIYANLDREAPSAPLYSYQKINSSMPYNEGNWVNESVRVTLQQGNSSARDISGWDKFIVTHKYGSTEKNIDVFGDNPYYIISEDNTNKLEYSSCDKANNCSAKTGENVIKIDKIAPSCTTKKYKNDTTEELTNNDWVNASSNYYVRVKNICKDNENGSGCESSSQYYDYKDNINTNNAGALGVNNGGTVSDKAGNVAQCVANQTVKIDKEAPTCSLLGESTTWAKSRTILATATDTGGSGLVGDNEKKIEYPTASTDKVTIKQDEVKATFSDNAGNTATCKKTANIYVDTEPPKDMVVERFKGTCDNTTGSYNGEWVESNLCAKAGGATDTGVGGVYYLLTVTGATPNVINQRVEPVQLEAVATGTTNAGFKACDGLDNCTDPSNTALNIDKTTPSCEVVKTTINSSSGVTGYVKCNDTGSPCSKQDFSKLKTTKSYTVSDAVGHTATCKVSISSYACSCKTRKAVTTYTGTYCYSKTTKKFSVGSYKVVGTSWKSCASNSSDCSKSFCGGSSGSQGCCWAKVCTATCYK